MRVPSPFIPLLAMLLIGPVRGGEPEERYNKRLRFDHNLDMAWQLLKNQPASANPIGNGPETPASKRGQFPDSNDNLRKLQNKLLPQIMREKLEEGKQLKFSPFPDTQAWPGPDAAEDVDEHWENLLENFMEYANDSDWGEFLQQFPAWRKSMSDVRQWLENDRFQRAGGSIWQEWARRINWRPNWDAHLERLNNLPLPKLPRVRLPAPRFEMPRFGAPSLGGTSAPASWQPAGWLVLIVAAGALAWFWWRGVARPVARRAGLSLGPWPVAPECVNTRAELVQAFDYLALLHLGEQARTWNHLLVAEKFATLSESNEPRASATGEAAQRLACLYEAARYTDGAAELGPHERVLARRDLCFLNGCGSRLRS